MSTISSNTAHRSTSGTAISRLGLRSRVISAGLATIAVLVCTAAVSAPAMAATTGGCRLEGVGWNSAPFSATMSGAICDYGGTNGHGSCPGGPIVHTSMPGWAEPVVSITGIKGGCYHISAYGGAESMWVNISLKITDPAEPEVTWNETVWLRIAMTSNGTTHKQAGS